MKKVFCATFSFLILQNIHSQNFISEKNETGAIPVVTSSQVTSIYVDSTDDWLVHKAASLLQSDIEMVTGKKPEIINDIRSIQGNAIVIGTTEKSSLIKQLAQQKKIDIANLKNKWESFLIQTIQSNSNKTNPKLPFRGFGGTKLLP